MKLGIMYTGGTIGCFYRPLRPMTSEEFAKLFNQSALPILRSKYKSLEIDYIPFGPPALDSTNLQPNDWCKLVDLILPRFCDFDAFLILHGTDTMAWSASALSFLFTGIGRDGHREASLNKPVILTGSQVPLFDGETPETATMRFNTDAFQNVCGAVQSAYYGLPGVCLFFNRRLFLGTRTQKTSSNQFDAFSSPNYPPLAQVGIDFTLNHGKIRVRGTSPKVLLGASGEARQVLQEQLSSVMKKYLSKIRLAAFEAYPGDPERMAMQLEDILHLDDPDRQLHAVILESYGAGNFPSGDPDEPSNGALYKVLARATEKGVIIVNNTSCLSGMVDSSTYASGSWLEKIKAVSAYDMTPAAIYTKLLFILSLAKKYNWDQDKVKLVFLSNLAGEMMDVHCLDTFGQRELWPGESITSRDGTARLSNNIFAGPQLTLLDRETGEWTSEPVWSALDPDRKVGLTCILRMQADGNLVFRSNTLERLWESGTAQDTATGEHYSRLELIGQTDPRGASLFVYNFVSNVVTKQLYPPVEKNDSSKRQKTS